MDPVHREPVCLTEAEPLPQESKIWDKLQLLSNAKRAAGFAIKSTLAIGAGVAVANLFGDTTVTTDYTETEIHTEIQTDFSGGSRVNTPIFDVDYPTHKGPLGLEATLDDLSLSRLAEDLTPKPGRSAPEPDVISRAVAKDSLEVSEAAKDHAIRYLLIAGSATSLGFLALSRNGPIVNRRKLTGAFLVGGMMVAGPIGIGYATWDHDGFNKPTYTYDLPDQLEDPDIIKNLDKYDETVSEQFRYIPRFVQAIEELNNRPEEDIAVRGVLIGDIHLRNVYPTVKSLISNYGADFVLDAGDIVDMGQAYENGFFMGTTNDPLRDNTIGIADLEVPYYYVQGNHDSQDQTVEALSSLPNVRILETGKYFTQNGLVITGAQDPLFTPNLGVEDDIDEETEIQSGLLLQIELDKRPADIAALHNPVAGKQIIGGTQLQVSGHTHKFNFQQPKPGEAPARVNSGTSGGAGLRNFNNTDGTETEQTFTMLNFGKDCRLISLDKISITSLDGNPEFNVTHIPVNETYDPDLLSGRTCE